MATTTVHHFVVESQTRASGVTTTKLPQAPGASHMVKITNRSTVDYDFELDGSLATPAGARSLSYAVNPADSWSVQWANVLGRTSVHDTRALDVHGPAATNQQVRSDAFRYRQSHPGIGPGGGGLWVTTATHPLPLVVNVQVI